MNLLSRSTLIASMIVSTAAVANDVPTSGRHDARVRFADYHPDEVFHITGVYRSATQIVFAPDERIAHVALGDTISWEVAPAENMLFLKPREFAGPTNLIVTTRTAGGLRSYTFELVARRGTIGPRAADTYFQVRFRYPADEAAAARQAVRQAAAQQLKAAEQAAVKSALDVGVLEGKRNLAYTLQGATELQPSEVSDNGVSTVMRFPNQRELPTVYRVLPDGSEAIVPFDVRDDFIVIHALAKEFRLRRGRLVLAVYNENPSFYGQDYKTDTASPIVQRTTKGEDER